MARRTTEKDIMRFIELKVKETEIKEELKELREMFLDDMDDGYTTPDAENENAVHIAIGKSDVKITTVFKRVFNSSLFAKEHKKLYEQYREDKTEDKVVATSDR